MKAWRIVPALLPIVVFCSSSTRMFSSASPASSYDKANKAEIHAYIMLIRLRGDLYGKWKATGKWPDDADANHALGEHSRYWQDRLHEGRAILAGGMNGDYWDNVAIILFEASSQAEADQIVAADPAVKAYVFQAQVRPFDIHWLTNKYNSELTSGTEAAK
jgi:uncharacterized protein YciI